MNAVNALAVQELRRRSGAGMMDCKAALEEAAGDMEKAADVLRTRGLAAAVKKSGRAASQGSIALACDERAGLLMEVNCETDFVARNEQFLRFVSELAQLALASELAQEEDALSTEALSALPWPHAGDGKTKTAGDALAAAVGALGENIVLRRVRRMPWPKPGLLGSYMHNSRSAREASVQCGQIGVLVGLRTDISPATPDLKTLARGVAMHIAANAPLAVDSDGVDEKILQREREIYRAEAQTQGKPENLLERIVEGRVKKFYADSVLLQQKFVLDAERQVQEVLAERAQALGGALAVAGFARWMLGEESEPT